MATLTVRRILHPTDFSAFAAGAFAHTLALAEVFGAELHLLHAVVLHGVGPAVRLPSDEEDAVPRELTLLAGQAQAKGLQVTTAVRRGLYPGPVILDYAEERDLDLTVMATHGRRGPSRLLLGSVTEEVLRHSRRPVLTVRTGATAHRGLPVRRVLAAVDLAMVAQPVVAAAAEIARRFAADLDLVHVFEQPVRPETYGIQTSRDVLMRRQEVEPLVLAELGRLATAEAAEVSVTSHLRFGRAATEILSLAEDLESDLLVIAGFGGLHRLLFGSTAEQLLRLAPCPLLVLRGETAGEAREPEERS